MLGSQLPGFPGSALHAHPSLAVAFGNPSGLKHWLKALLWLARPFVLPTIIFPVHSSSVRGGGLCGTPAGENPFLEDRVSTKGVRQANSHPRIWPLFTHTIILCFGF